MCCGIPEDALTNTVKEWKQKDDDSYPINCVVKLKYSHFQSCLHNKSKIFNTQQKIVEVVSSTEIFVPWAPTKQEQDNYKNQHFDDLNNI